MFFKQDIIEDSEDDAGSLRDIIRELYEAMKDDSVERRWKKQAIEKVLQLETLLGEILAEAEVPELEIRKGLRSGRELLQRLQKH